MIAKINGVKLYYEVKGSGPRPLILLHGNEEDGLTFKGLERYLGDEFTLYVLDSRAHGQSSNVDILRYEDMAKDLIAFIKFLKLDKPAVFGYSDGGNIALSAAVLEPKLFGDIVVAGANTSQDGLGGYLESMIKEYKETKSKYIDLMLNGPNITTKELKNIASKVIALRGEHDLIDKKHSIYFAKAIPNGKYVELPGEDHGSFVFKTEKLAALIKEYLI